MSNSASDNLVRSAAHPLRNTATDLDSLIDLAADASFALLGEASHGTLSTAAKKHKLHIESRKTEAGDRVYQTKIKN